MALFFRAGAWTSAPVIAATHFRDRLRGLRPDSEGRALLLKGSSVHGIGMRESLWVIGLDDEATVVDVRLLVPGRVVRIPRATRLLEIAATEPPPPIGSTLIANRDSD